MMAPSGGREPSLQQLRLLVILAEELHFGRTARRSHMSQPAVSRHIAALEQQLGVQLFERATRTVSISAAGHALVEPARAVIDAADELLTQAAREAEQISGRLVIGSFEALSAMPPIPRVLKEIRERHPRIGIEVRRLGFDEIADAILDGDVEAAFVFLPVSEGIQVEPLTVGPRCVAMSSKDPLASRPSIALAELGRRPFIGMSDRIPDAWRRFWSCDPRPDGSPVDYTPHAVTDFDSALPLIALGEGIHLPPAAARLLYPRPGVSYVDVTDLPPCTAALAWLPKNRDSPLLTTLRRLARATATVTGDGSSSLGEC
jgi:DNA-binding transcriptional LysR family regulator